MGAGASPTENLPRTLSAGVRSGRGGGGAERWRQIISRRDRPTKPVGLYAAGTVDVGGSPQALLTHAHSLWIATPSSVVRLNLRNGSTIARTPIPTNGVNAVSRLAPAASGWRRPARLRCSGSTRQATDSSRTSISGVTENGRLGSLGGGVAFAAGRIWVSRDSNSPRGDVISVNPTTNQADAAPITVGSGPETVVSAFGSIWVDNTSVVVGNRAPSRTYRAVSRIDLRTRRVSTEPFSGTPATGFGSLWVQTNAASDNAAIVRVNPSPDGRWPGSTCRASSASPRVEAASGRSRTHDRVRHAHSSRSRALRRCGRSIRELTVSSANPSISRSPSPSPSLFQMGNSGSPTIGAAR